MAEGSDRASKSTPSSPADALKPIEIDPPLRWCSGVAGAAAMVFGTLAVFKTDSEAGPVALLAVGLLFGFVAMAGVVPWKIKFGDTEFELLRVAEKLEEREAELEEIGERAAVASAAPELEAQILQPPSVIAGSPTAESAFLMAQRLKNLLVRAGAEAGVAVSLPARARDQYDATITKQGSPKRIVVEIKARSRPISRANVRRVTNDFTAQFSQQGFTDLLFITNQHAHAGIPLDAETLKHFHWFVASDDTDEADLAKYIGSLFDD